MDDPNQGRQPSGQIQFGIYKLDVRSGELLKNGFRIRLQGKPLTVLMALLENPGELVTRAELYERLWPSEASHDLERGLNVAVAKLRSALCDSSSDPKYIETVPCRGYRFVAQVITIVGLTGLLS
jgi:DNA-binding winged helix-turn-helix (wHTH) protein